MALAFAQSHPSFPYQVVANQVRQNQFALGQTMANIGQFALRGKSTFKRSRFFFSQDHSFWNLANFSQSIDFAA